MDYKFNFEQLDIWKKAVDLNKAVIALTERIETNRKHYRLIEQLEACSTSVALNIAEGKGRYSKKEFINFLYISKGSLFETIALVLIFENNGWIQKTDVTKIKKMADELGKMISALINSIKSKI